MRDVAAYALGIRSARCAGPHRPYLRVRSGARVELADFDRTAARPQRRGDVCR